MTTLTESPCCNSLKKEKKGFSYIHRNTKEALEFGFLQQCCNLLGFLLTEELITNRSIPKSEQTDGLHLPQLYMNKRIYEVPVGKRQFLSVFQHQDMWMQLYISASIPSPCPCPWIWDPGSPGTHHRTWRTGRSW